MEKTQDSGSISSPYVWTLSADFKTDAWFYQSTKVRRIFGTICFAGSAASAAFATHVGLYARGTPTQIIKLFYGSTLFASALFITGICLWAFQSIKDKGYATQLLKQAGIKCGNDDLGILDIHKNYPSLVKAGIIGADHHLEILQRDLTNKHLGYAALFARHGSLASLIKNDEELKKIIEGRALREIRETAIGLVEIKQKYGDLIQENIITNADLETLFLLHLKADLHTRYFNYPAFILKHGEDFPRNDEIDEHFLNLVRPNLENMGYVGITVQYAVLVKRGLITSEGLRRKMLDDFGPQQTYTEFVKKHGKGNLENIPLEGGVREKLADLYLKELGEICSKGTGNTSVLFHKRSREVDILKIAENDLASTIIRASEAHMREQNASYSNFILMHGESSLQYLSDEGKLYFTRKLIEHVTAEASRRDCEVNDLSKQYIDACRYLGCNFESAKKAVYLHLAENFMTTDMGYWEFRNTVSLKDLSFLFNVKQGLSGTARAKFLQSSYEEMITHPADAKLLKVETNEINDVVKADAETLDYREFKLKHGLLPFKNKIILNIELYQTYLLEFCKTCLWTDFQLSIEDRCALGIAEEAKKARWEHQTLVELTGGEQTAFFDSLNRKELRSPEDWRSKIIQETCGMSVAQIFAFAKGKLFSSRILSRDTLNSNGITFRDQFLSEVQHIQSFEQLCTTYPTAIFNEPWISMESPFLEGLIIKFLMKNENGVATGDLSRDDHYTVITEQGLTTRMISDLNVNHSNAYTLASQAKDARNRQIKEDSEQEKDAVERTLRTEKAACQQEFDKQKKEFERSKGRFEECEKKYKTEDELSKRLTKREESLREAVKQGIGKQEDNEKRLRTHTAKLSRLEQEISLKKSAEIPTFQKLDELNKEIQKLEMEKEEVREKTNTTVVQGRSQAAAFLANSTKELKSLEKKCQELIAQKKQLEKTLKSPALEPEKKELTCLIKKLREEQSSLKAKISKAREEYQKFLDGDFNQMYSIKERRSNALNKLNEVSGKYERLKKDYDLCVLTYNAEVRQLEEQLKKDCSGVEQNAKHRLAASKEQFDTEILEHRRIYTKGLGDRLRFLQFHPQRKIA